ncbi:MAG: GGDEF domain-containing protein [Phycisphaerales bacterium]|nr:GGDEF domain-containing protein [Phycisphaerales bacterium]
MSHDPETTDPLPSPAPTRRRDLHGVWALRTTMLAGLLGIAACAAGLLVADRLGLAPAWAAVAGIVVGVLVQASAVPWRAHQAHRTFYGDLAAMTTALREMNPTNRREPLHRLPRERRDELGRLAQAIHDVFAEAIANRVGLRNLQRHLDHSIQRETDRAVATLRREALTDPLTGLGNRRGLELCLQRFYSPAGTPTVPIAALMIDLDRFKEINDTLGHGAGDACLAFTAEVVRATLRADDYAVRVGGDEFVAILVHTTARDAEAVARRLSALFVQQPWPHRDIPKPTLSVGVAATSPTDPCGPDELVHRADQALYAAKRGGRSRVLGFRTETEAA